MLNDLFFWIAVKYFVGLLLKQLVHEWFFLLFFSSIVKLKIILSRMEATAVKTTLAFNLRKINIELDEITRSERYVKKEGDAVKLDPPEEAVVYCTQAVTTN